MNTPPGATSPKNVNGLRGGDVGDELAGDVDPDEQRRHRLPVLRFAVYSRLATVCTPPRMR